MLANLFRNYYETVAVILFGIGFTTLLLHRNMIKKIIGDRKSVGRERVYDMV